MPQPQHFFPASVAPPLQHPPVSITIDSKPFSPVKEDDGYDTDSPVLKFAKPPPKPRPESRFIKRESVTWNVRPPAQEVYENLEEFFPDHDLDKPLLDPSGAATASASSSALAGMGDSPQTPLSAAVQSPLGGRPVRHRKTIRHVATERKKILDRTSKIAAEETPEAAMVRKRSTKLWNTKIEEVSSRAGIPSTIPESPATTGAKPITRWIKGDLIGKGTYGKVFLALNANTGEMIAVKQVELPKTASDQADARQRIVVDAIKSESAVLRDLEHPNVVQYLGFEETMDHFNLFLEYVPGGSIGGVLRKMGQFDEDVTKNFTKQILNGLDYLHSRGVWHRDLKGDNILVDTHGVCKISDFGISKRNADFESFDKGATNMMGSIFWMAPEVMAKSDLGYNGKVDIWSVGCVYVEMITGRRPWDDENFVSVMFKVSTMREAPPLPNVDEFGRDFCELCFERDPTRRPTAAALRAHQYLNLPSNWSFVDFVNRLH
ncbi:Pkinase-domain-containing protein [Auriculariales sp. MPI-PUGE-AT-0066]|nr:Pkinase-domain-containing protein [Auriculariales sp. MPI-PUGE-AT-0066]